MNSSDFDYTLPASLIAQEPISPRDASRLMVCDRVKGTWLHQRFTDLPTFLNPGDLLVFNNTRVIPARIFGKKATTGARIEFLLVSKHESASVIWTCLAKPAKRLQIGDEILFEDKDSKEKWKATVLEKHDQGECLLSFESVEGPRSSFSSFLSIVGQLPTPPYIRKTLRAAEDYQTIYAAKEGAIAAPTAGFHFTESLLQTLRDKGVQTAFVTLHVGIGTFKPVVVDSLADHIMHSEWYECPESTWADVIRTRKAGGRVIAVGTTTTRVLETVALYSGSKTPRPPDSKTNLFITPGYEFKAIDGLITNFHLPKSTLLMLVSAFIGQSFMKNIYEEAIVQHYRFYSFGDAMLAI
jgi:S-adenosylmethionine:tRNA ribosyltransferase-isomerase